MTTPQILGSLETVSRTVARLGEDLAHTTRELDRTKEILSIARKERDDLREDRRVLEKSLAAIAKELEVDIDKDFDLVAEVKKLREAFEVKKLFDGPGKALSSEGAFSLAIKRQRRLRRVADKLRAWSAKASIDGAALRELAKECLAGDSDGPVDMQEGYGPPASGRMDYSPESAAKKEGL